MHIRRLDVERAPSRDATRAGWSRRTLSVGGLVAAAMIVAPMIDGEPDGADADWERQPLAAICTPWHVVAGDAVTHLMRGTHDAELNRVGDALFRIRRARRNCEAGWFNLACQDYRAVVQSVPTLASTWPHASVPCTAFLSDVDD